MEPRGGRPKPEKSVTYRMPIAPCVRHMCSSLLKGGPALVGDVGSGPHPPNQLQRSPPNPSGEHLVTDPSGCTVRVPPNPSGVVRAVPLGPVVRLPPNPSGVVRVVPLGPVVLLPPNPSGVVEKVPFGVVVRYPPKPFGVDVAVPEGPLHRTPPNPFGEQLVVWAVASNGNANTAPNTTARVESFM